MEELTIYDASTGRVLSNEQAQNPQDSTPITATIGGTSYLVLSENAFSPDFRKQGVTLFDANTQFQTAGYVDVSTGDVTLIGPPETSSNGGFDAGTKVDARYVGFNPATSQEWFGEYTGIIHEGSSGPTQTYADAPQDGRFVFSPDGTQWGVDEGEAGGQSYFIPSSALSVDSLPFKPFGGENYTNLSNLVPATNYRLGDAWLSQDGTSVAFLATPPGANTTSLLTVSASGGEPKTIAAGLSATSIIFYGTDTRT